MASDMCVPTGVKMEKHNYAGLFQNVIHKVMASDMYVPAGA